MLKENKKTLVITSIVTLLPMLAGIYFWKRLPDVMATHFGFGNEADGFTSKTIAVFVMPMFLLAIEWVGAIVTSRDPRKQNISPKMFVLVLWLVPVISLMGAATIFSYNLGYSVNIALVGQLVVGLLFIIIGNYLPKARQNYTVGIKIAWTLANEENWNRTHRLAGYLWMIGGLLLVINAITRICRLEWLLGIFAVMVLVPFVYSFWLHEKKGL